jgi:hypothetical protein
MTRSLAITLGLLSSLVLLAGCPGEMPRSDTGTIDTGTVGVDGGDGGMITTDTPVVTDTPGGRVCGIGTPGCDVITQGCEDVSGVAQGCYFVADETMANTICAESGALGEGAACTGGVNACAEGLACFDGFCRDYCCMGNAGDCMLGYLCRQFGGPSGVTPIGICVPPDDCTVIPNGGCDAGESCEPSADGTLSCVTAGPNAAGEECGETAGGCTAGNVCVGPMGGPFTCVELCLISEPVCPRTGTTCMATGGIGGGYGTCLM